MQFSKAGYRKIETLVNRINSRVKSIEKTIGTESEAYNSYVKTMYSVNALVNGDSGLVLESTDKEGNVHYKLSKSRKNWDKVLEKAGLEKINELFNELNKKPTVPELKKSLPQEYEKVTGQKPDNMTLKEIAETLYNFNDLISDAWSYLYAIGYQEGNQTARDLIRQATGNHNPDEWNGKAIGLANKLRDKKETIQVDTGFIDFKKNRAKIIQHHKYNLKFGKTLHPKTRKQLEQELDEARNMDYNTQGIDRLNAIKKGWKLK